VALIKDFKRLEKDRYTKHKEAKASYSIFTKDNSKFLQIDTYGSEDRMYKGKISQSIQLDKEGLKELVEIIISNFSNI
jgi:uncharacterized glyoxalase superfamily protein PhnB